MIAREGHVQLLRCDLALNRKANRYVAVLFISLERSRCSYQDFRVLSCVMKLSDWLAQNNMNAAEFGRRLGLKYPRNVYRYINGRIPPPEIIRQITAATDGAVTANDFMYRG